MSVKKQFKKKFFSLKDVFTTIFKGQERQDGVCQVSYKAVWLSSTLQSSLVTAISFVVKHPKLIFLRNWSFLEIKKIWNGGRGLVDTGNKTFYFVCFIGTLKFSARCAFAFCPTLVKKKKLILLFAMQMSV